MRASLPHYPRFLLIKMSSSEIDITKLSNEQLDGLRKQTEAVGCVSCKTGMLANQRFYGLFDA